MFKIAIGLFNSEAIHYINKLKDRGWRLMFPAYTKYEYINRIVVPGFALSMCSAMTWQLNIPIEQMALFIATSTIPVGYAIDISRDWVGYGLEKASKKIKPFRMIIPKLRKAFREYFFHLETQYNVSKDDALKINYKFFFDMTAQQRYYFSVRQAWASLTINIFISGLFLLVQQIVHLCLSNEFDLFPILLTLFITMFFYYAGIYRLNSVARLYNLLLDEYYNKNHK